MLITERTIRTSFHIFCKLFDKIVFRKLGFKLHSTIIVILEHIYLAIA